MDFIWKIGQIKSLEWINRNDTALFFMMRS